MDSRSIASWDEQAKQASKEAKKAAAQLAQRRDGTQTTWPKLKSRQRPKTRQMRTINNAFIEHFNDSYEQEISDNNF